MGILQFFTGPKQESDTERREREIQEQKEIDEMWKEEWKRQDEELLKSPEAQKIDPKIMQKGSYSERKIGKNGEVIGYANSHLSSRTKVTAKGEEASSQPKDIWPFAATAN